MVDTMVGCEVQILVGACLFPVYQDLQATVLFANDKCVQESHAAFVLLLLGELNALGIIHCF